MSSSEEKQSLPDVVRRFVPAWFAFNMGTGSISLLFHTFPYGTHSVPLNVLSITFLCLNILLFIIFTLISIARYIQYPHIWSLMLRHPVQSLFTGTMPMGLATIITTTVVSVVEEYNFGGPSLAYLCWAFWWFDVVISGLCCFGMVFLMGTRHAQTLENMTALWLLPVVTLIVASSCGGVLAPVIQKYSPDRAILTVAVSIFLVAIGLSLALMILTVYLLRLIVHGLPPGPSILSVFLPLGPTGQAGFSILLVGQYFKKALPVNHGGSEFLNSAVIGDIIYGQCVIIAFVLWSLASMWDIFALISLLHAIFIKKTKFTFGTNFFGMIFPNGVYANLTIALAATFDSAFFRVWGAIYACFTLCLWTGVALNTVRHVYRRDMFQAPCLE
ncbi:voltage-dependent anion channel [Flagelloscypha sp. PMI_526]|nr:voltage-dependent anion channel [Flagelloscypha sp. PMI_526]